MQEKFYKIIGGKISKTAVLIYDSFCNFEISVALEILALNNIKSINSNIMFS